MWHVGDIAEKKKCKTGQHEKMAILTHLAAFCLAGLSACPGRLGHPLVDSVPPSWSMLIMQETMRGTISS